SRAEPSSAAAPEETAQALRLVGALLVGAALAAVVQLLVPVGFAQPLVAVAIASALLLAARRLVRRDAPSSDLLCAIALVACGSTPFYAVSPPGYSAIAAALAVAATLLQRGRTPLALLWIAAFFVNARDAAGAAMLEGAALGAELPFLAALVAYFVLLARRRAARWGERALAAQGLALAVGVFPLLDALGVTDAGIAALGLAVALLVLFALALRLRARSLALTTGGLLAFVGTAFAFLAVGPALAAIALLCVGAAFVWRAERLRGYFRAPAR
ncbi:MAG TPA: hypothetical protein VM582_03195, partial [Candidatus Thermoplasmatota archaeon]|nr:hypothetical protein [Candidatus Thermoplasmatota archaeon]